MGDLFWDAVTSYPVLCLIGLMLIASLFVGYMPLLKWFPVIGPYVPAARLIVLIAAGLLFFLVGFRVADGRAEAKALRVKLEAARIDAEAASDAAAQSDDARAEMARQSQSDKERIADYERQLKSRPQCGCTLDDGDFADGMRSGARSR